VRKKSKKENKTALTAIMLTPTHKEQITKIANDNNCDRSEYIRLLVIKEIERVNASIII